MELLSALNIFLFTLGSASRRRLSIGHPICRHRTFDELAVLALITARQENDIDRVAAHMRWLVIPDHREAVLKVLGMLVESANRANFRLSESPRDASIAFTDHAQK